VIVRSLEDAPGGRVFIGNRRSMTVDEMKRAADHEHKSKQHDSDSTDIVLRKGDEESNDDIEAALVADLYGCMYM